MGTEPPLLATGRTPGDYDGYTPWWKASPQLATASLLSILTISPMDGHSECGCSSVLLLGACTTRVKAAICQNFVGLVMCEMSDVRRGMCDV